MGSMLANASNWIYCGIRLLLLRRIRVQFVGWPMIFISRIVCMAREDDIREKMATDVIKSLSRNCWRADDLAPT